MDITYDPAKNERNIALRGLSFDEVAAFDFETALFWQDTRFDYPEPRFAALGYIKGRLHTVVFTETEHGIRVISFRKANKREVKRYEIQSRTD